MPSRRVVWFAVLAFSAITLMAQAQTALQFVAATPCRVVDTRWPNGALGGPAIAGQSSRDFIVSNSSCNIPNNAAAFSLNVTVVPHYGYLAYLTVWPTGQPLPVISTLNSLDGRIKANAAIVPAGTGGAISVYATDTTDVVLDIDGYFVPASSSTLAFFPLTPCRVADTRLADGPLGGPYLSGGKARSFPVQSSPCATRGAGAYSLNFTAVPKNPSLAYLTVWPTGQPQPKVSTLNALTGTITANAAIVPAGSDHDGSISVFATDDTDLVIDIDGYFAQANSGPGPLSLYTLAPCRVLDTRKTIGNFTGIIPVSVLLSPCNVPGAQAYVMNATVVPLGPLGYLTLWPDEEGKPLVSTLNAMDGAITSNMAIVPTLNGYIDAFAPSPTELVADIFSYFATIAPLAITTTSLPSGTVNYNYSTALGATGGVTPYSWSITSGSLPPGLNLDSGTGSISGSPTTPGNYPLTVQVSDSQSPSATASAQLSIAVNSTITQLTIVTGSLPAGTENASYSAMLAATGGITPYTWSITAGSLPNGLTLNSNTGAITGTPTLPGTANFTVKVSDSQVPAATASAQFGITIQPAVPLSITTTSLASGTVGTPYSATLAAIGGVTPYSWSLTAGYLPNGLVLNGDTGAIAGIPTGTGTANFTVQVSDSESPPVTVTAQLSITIASGGGDPGALKGNYAFFLNGFDAAGQWTLAGSFISDGKGNITSGVVDGNSVAGQPFNTTISGAYSIASSGLNTLTIQGQSFGPSTFAFVLSSSGNGRIIEYDDTNGQGSRGSGVLRKQDPSAFSLGKLSGGYVYGMTGADASGPRMTNVGVFTLASGNIENGTCDINDGGSYFTCSFTGSLSAVNAQTGRGASTVQSNNGTSHQAVYVVSASELVMEQIDSVPGTQTPLLVGSVLQQAGSFSNATLMGATILYYQDIHAAEGADQSGAMNITFDGNGNGNVVSADEDLAGTITQKQPGSANYTVAANGAVTFAGGGGAPAGFLVGQNRGFFVGTGSNSIFGVIEAQSGGPFSNASIAGTYTAGSLPPLDYANAGNEVMTGSADGVGTITMGDDSSNPGGIDQSLGNMANYSIASNGRGTGQSEGDKAPSVVYVISPTEFVVLMPKTDARVDVFEH